MTSPPNKKLIILSPSISKYHPLERFSILLALNQWFFKKNLKEFVCGNHPLEDLAKLWL
jgi:hypothetical protein